MGPRRVLLGWVSSALYFACLKATRDGHDKADALYESTGIPENNQHPGWIDDNPSKGAATMLDATRVTIAERRKIVAEIYVFAVKISGKTVGAGVDYVNGRGHRTRIIWLNTEEEAKQRKDGDVEMYAWM